MNADDESANLSPPVTPTGERLVPEDPVFAEACFAIISKVSAGWKLGVPIFSESDKWGTVFRVDYTIPGVETASLINRIICWKVPDDNVGIVIAIGQEQPPLPEPI
jgi:hypothetical protein